MLSERIALAADSAPARPYMDVAASRRIFPSRRRHTHVRDYYCGFAVRQRRRDSSPGLILLAMLLFLLPSSQCAIQIIDGIITEVLPAEILPKLDFSKGVPADCVTLVAVPTLAAQ